MDNRIAVVGDRYRLEERIGSGGTGDVWRCVDDVLGRMVAVKILPLSLLAEPGFTERFRVNARVMATINHPGVVDIYDYGSDPKAGAYLVMEYIEGDALSRTLSRVGRLTPARTMALVAQAADALQAMHDIGVVHRDVNPGHLLVRPNGTVVLTDFGFVRSVGAAQLTAAASVLRTASYISPEQAMGEQATPLSDIYALGVVAYHCLCGRRPFDGDNPLEIAMRHIREAPPPMPPDTPPAVRAIVERAMAKDPAQRWPTATALASVARRAAAELSAAAPRPGGMPATAQVEAQPFRPGQPTPTSTPASAPPGMIPIGGDRPAATAGGYGPGYRAQPSGNLPPPASRRGRRRWLRLPTRGSGGAPPPRSSSGRGQQHSDDEPRVEFTTAFQRRIHYGPTYRLLFLIHRSSDRAQALEVIRRRRPYFGEEPALSRASSSSTIPAGTTLTIVPNISGLVVEPPRIDIRVKDPIHELTFHFSAEPNSPIGKAEGHIDVYVNTLIVAQVPVAIDIVDTTSDQPQPTKVSLTGATSTEPLASTTAGLFERVFVSYSHRDAGLVDACTRVYQALGVKVMLDRTELTSGEQWRTHLHQLIVDADIFQLYWSSASATSAEVQHEWQVALGVDRKGSRFIRPLYWETPMPTPPQALDHLHFSRIDLAELEAFLREPPGAGVEHDSRAGTANAGANTPRLRLRSRLAANASRLVRRFRPRA